MKLLEKSAEARPPGRATSASGRVLAASAHVARDSAERRAGSGRKPATVFRRLARVGARAARRFRRPDGRGAAGLYAFFGVVGLLALVGVFLAAGLFSGAASRTSGQTSGTFGISQDVRTSFGVVTIESVDKSSGLTSQQLAGVNHGIQNYVSPDQVQVEVLVSLTNRLDVPTAYAPDQFVLITDKSGQPIAVTSASFREGSLQPHAQIEGKLSFTVPVGATKMILRYTDPAMQHPLMFDLGGTAGATLTS